MLVIVDVRDVVIVVVGDWEPVVVIVVVSLVVSEDVMEDVTVVV